MKYVAGLTVSIMFITRYTSLLDNPTLYKSADIIYGSNTLAISNCAVNQFDFDNTLVKLILALLVFSTCNYINYTNIAPINLMNIKKVLRIQDRYNRLVLRYLIYKYNHERTVLFFSNIIRYLFFDK